MSPTYPIKALEEGGACAISFQRPGKILVVFDAREADNADDGE
jgi:hypothetical protein